MHDGWRTVTLGEFTDVAIERQRVNSDSGYPVAGVLNAGRGLFDRGSMLGRETSYPVLHQLRAGRVVMRKLTAWEGTVAVVPRAFNGFHVSTEFPTFRLDERCILIGFMALICQYPPFWEALKDRSTGTVQRRKRVSPSAFLTVPILLPPLADQRRIVDLIGAIDECLRAVGLQQTAVAAVITSFRETRLEELAAENVDLGQVLVGIEAGRSPAAKDRPPQSSERAVLKVSAIRSGEFDPAEVKTVDSLTALPEASRVRVGDVLMTRANTRDLVGSVCIVDEVPDNYYLCDKTLAARSCP